MESERWRLGACVIFNCAMRGCVLVVGKEVLWFDPAWVMLRRRKYPSPRIALLNALLALQEGEEEDHGSADADRDAERPA